MSLDPFAAARHPEDAALEALQAHFSRHATIGMTPLAALLPMDRKTLARHVAAGSLVGRLKGLGRARRHRVFTLADVNRFMQHLAEDAPCPSIDTSDRRSGNMNSGSVVLSFPDRRGPTTNVKRVKSKAGKKKQPGATSTTSSGPTPSP